MTSRISSGTLTVGIVAILVGLVGAYGVRSLLQAEPAETPAAPATVQIPLANASLPPERVIQPGDLTLTTVKVDALQAQGISLGRIISEPKFAIGRRVREPIDAGDPILSTKLYLEGTGPTLADQLKPGERMVTIPVEATKGGLAPVGATVDVLFRTRARAGNEFVSPIPEMTVTLLERVRVLDTQKPNVMDGATLVTLAVPADEANKVEVAEDHGTFSVVARPDGDYHRVASGDTPLTIEKILDIQPPEPPAPTPEPEVFQTIVFRGTAASVNRFVDRRPLRDYPAGAIPATRGLGVPNGFVGPHLTAGKIPAHPSDCQVCFKDPNRIDLAPIADPYLATRSGVRAETTPAATFGAAESRTVAPSAPGLERPTLAP